MSQEKIEFELKELEKKYRKLNRVYLHKKLGQLIRVAEAAMEVTRGNPNLPFNVINSQAVHKMQKALRELIDE